MHDLVRIVTERLLQFLADTPVKVLNNEPFLSSSQPKLASIQPTPAVHVYEKSLRILEHHKKDKNHSVYRVEIELWIVLLIKNNYEQTQASYQELTKLQNYIFGILGNWEPNIPPFSCELKWSDERVEVFHDPIIGYTHQPFILKPDNSIFLVIKNVY